MKTASRAWNGSTEHALPRRNDVPDRARRKLARDCPSAYFFKDIIIEYHRGVLTLRGQLPTYNLKSVLETTLAHLEGVDRIDNQVDVISSRGVSSLHGT